MSVSNGRRSRLLLPAAIAFKQLSRQPTLTPQPSFGRTVALSLVGIVSGTIVVTVGIVHKQTSVIVFGFIIMLCVLVWFWGVVYS